MDTEDLEINAEVLAQFQFQQLLATLSSMARGSIGAVAIKLPTFWTMQLEFWFAQSEAHFATHNITGQLTKFYYVVARQLHCCRSGSTDIEPT